MIISNVTVKSNIFTVFYFQGHAKTYYLDNRYTHIILAPVSIKYSIHAIQFTFLHFTNCLNMGNLSFIKWIDFKSEKCLPFSAMTAPLTSVWCKGRSTQLYNTWAHFPAQFSNHEVKILPTRSKYVFSGAESDGIGPEVRICQVFCAAR